MHKSTANNFRGKGTKGHEKDSTEGASGQPQDAPFLFARHGSKCNSSRPPAFNPTPIGREGRPAVQVPCDLKGPLVLRLSSAACREGTEHRASRRTCTLRLRAVLRRRSDRGPALWEGLAKQEGEARGSPKSSRGQERSGRIEWYRASQGREQHDDAGLNSTILS